MYIKISKEEFMEKAKKDCYWTLTDKATQRIYEVLTELNAKFDLNGVLNDFMWGSKEMTLTDIWEETKGTFKTMKELEEYLEYAFEIKIDNTPYTVFASFEYENKEKGYILRF